MQQPPREQSYKYHKVSNLRMEDEVALYELLSEARYFLSETNTEIGDKSYSNALLNLYKVEEYNAYLIAEDPTFKKSLFAKEVEKTKSKLKKSASKEKVDLDFLLKSLGLEGNMSSTLELKYRSPTLPNFFA